MSGAVEQNREVASPRAERAPEVRADGPPLAAGPAGPAAQPEPLEQLGRSFKRAMAAVRRLRGRETHHPSGLSNAQYGLLFSLSGACRMSARDLADAAELTSATVAQMLDHLAAAGLVERTRSERDKRVVLTSLTPLGQELIDERRARIEPLWRAALSPFSDEELLTAVAVLDRLAEHFAVLDQTSATPPHE
ncbi:MAG: MarR family winged helix-turn-helix transcriptional regulator [Solirubrobacteraceae bacterium]